MPGRLAKHQEGPNESPDYFSPHRVGRTAISARFAASHLIVVWLIAIALALLVWRAANH